MSKGEFCYIEKIRLHSACFAVFLNICNGFQYSNIPVWHHAHAPCHLPCSPQTLLTIIKQAGSRLTLVIYSHLFHCICKDLSDIAQWDSPSVEANKKSSSHNITRSSAWSRSYSSCRHYSYSTFAICRGLRLLLYFCASLGSMQANHILLWISLAVGCSFSSK